MFALRMSRRCALTARARGRYPVGIRPSMFGELSSATLQTTTQWSRSLVV
jgi:hypothetical protein